MKSKEPPQTFVPKILVSWDLEWVNCEFTGPAISYKLLAINVKLFLNNIIIHLKIFFGGFCDFCGDKAGREVS